MDFRYQTDDEKQRALAQFLQAQEQARKLMQLSNMPDEIPQDAGQADMNLPETNMSPYISAIGTGGLGNSVASGFGQIRGNIPVGENTTISPYAGGAGVRGSAGGQRFGMFMPQVGVNFTHKY